MIRFGGPSGVKWRVVLDGAVSEGCAIDAAEAIRLARIACGVSDVLNVDACEIQTFTEPVRVSETVPDSVPDAVPEPQTPTPLADPQSTVQNFVEQNAGTAPQA